MIKAAATMTFLLALLSISVLSQASLSNRSADERQLLKLVDEINRAYVNRNYAPFEEYYLDNFVRIRSRPIYNAKAQIVAMMKADGRTLAAGKRLDFETISYESRNMTVDLFGPVAIVRSVRLDRWRYRGSECTTRSPTTDVWLKRSGNWRLFGSHSSTLPCRPMPWVPLHPAVEAVGTVSVAPVSGSTEENELRALFATNAEGGALIFAPGYAHTDALGKISGDKLIIAAVNEALSSDGREDEGFLVTDDAGLFIFRAARVRDGVRISELYSVVVVRGEGKWRIVASHSTRAD